MDEFHALFAVDIEDFSGHRDVDLPVLQIAMRTAVDAAFADCGLSAVWRSVDFLESTGDGLLAILPLASLATLVDRLPGKLQERLAEGAPGLRGRGMRLRIRLAVHVGMTDGTRAEAPGVSRALVDVCRLLDGGPLRDALKLSDPLVTHTALLVSEAAFTAFVAAGRTGLSPSQFTQVEVEVKRFRQPAYLYVPVPSRGQQPPGASPGRPARPGPPADSGAVTNSVSGSTFHGPVIQGRDMPSIDLRSYRTSEAAPDGRE
ncbi:hypothetical protein [Actinocorallia longicatena]|uniref:Guanylate cyclase domain-containing protein n=1 Tax=Actinocorallia longicatena TaxID=111803 RepID=A0ABP6Q3E8_9ACTN